MLFAGLRVLSTVHKLGWVKSLQSIDSPQSTYTGWLAVWHRAGPADWQSVAQSLARLAAMCIGCVATCVGRSNEHACDQNGYNAYDCIGAPAIIALWI